MFYISDDEGTINTYQGDSGTLTVSGIYTDQNYRVYFAIQDEERNPIGDEIMVSTLNSDAVSISIPAELTDKLAVPAGKKSAVYYYGVKLVTPGTLDEDTVYAGKMIVYPKRVEGA